MADDFVFLFTGRLVRRSGRWALHRISGYEGFDAKKKELAVQGLQLSALDIDEVGGATWYTGAWLETSEGAGYYGAASAEQLEENFQGNGCQGLADLNIYRAAGGEVWHTGVYLGNTPAQRLDLDLSWADLVKSYNRNHRDGFGMVKIQCVEDSQGQSVFSAFYQEGHPGSVAYRTSNWQAFMDDYRRSVGHRTPMTYQVVERPSQPLRLYLGAYGDLSTFRYIMRAPWEQFISQCTELANSGWKLVSIEVQRDPTSWQAALKKVYGKRAVGYSFAVGDGRKVIEQGAQGWAIKPDSSTNTQGVAMSKDTSLTLGSISKTLGAVTVVHMMQSGDYEGLSLSNSVFDLVEGHHGIEAGILQDQRVRDVTLQQMLTMTSGLQEANVPGNQLEPSVLWRYIRAYLSQRLHPEWLGPDGKPGQVYRYSNGAYLALRGIIEVVTGLPYEIKVQEVLALAGLRSSRTRLPVIGQSYPVRYYNAQFEPAGGATIGNEASWLSSASDMILLLNAFRSSANGALQTVYQIMAATYPARYQVRQHEDGTWERVEAPVGSFVGFDAMGDQTTPAFRAKGGTYTNGSSAQILSLQDPACDVVYQSNTDATNPLPVLLNQSVDGPA